MNLVHMDISSPLQDDGNGGDDSTTTTTATAATTTTSNRNVGVTPPLDTHIMEDALSKLSSLSFSSSSGIKKSLEIVVEDNEDPFRDFEELDDTSSKFEIKTTTTFTTYPQGFDIATTLDSVRSLCTSPRGRELFFSKYRDSDDDYGGVDMDVESFVAMAEYSYVNNKIMEIASVKEEAERSQAVLHDNPGVVHALYEILTAKQRQIEKALDREKINKHDHSKLLERLNAVKDLLKPKSATW